MKAERKPEPAGPGCCSNSDRRPGRCQKPASYLVPASWSIGISDSGPHGTSAQRTPRLVQNLNRRTAGYWSWYLVRNPPAMSAGRIRPRGPQRGNPPRFRTGAARRGLAPPFRRRSAANPDGYLQTARKREQKKWRFFGRILVVFLRFWVVLFRVFWGVLPRYATIISRAARFFFAFSPLGAVSKT